MLPVFRSSPEVIIDGEYSKASDMWAFGVMIWEMFTLIDKELDESNEEVIPYNQLSSKEQVRIDISITFNHKFYRNVSMEFTID